MMCAVGKRGRRKKKEIRNSEAMNVNRGKSTKQFSFAIWLLVELIFHSKPSVDLKMDLQEENTQKLLHFPPLIDKKIQTIQNHTLKTYNYYYY